MKIRLAGFLEDKYIVVHWFYDLKSKDQVLSFNEMKREKESNRLKDTLSSYIPFVNGSFMIVRFDISNGQLYLNEYETFKYKYIEETEYMGSKENLNQFVRDYFTESNIQLMLSTLIKSPKTKQEHREFLEKYLTKNVKQDTVNKKVEKEEEKQYFRYDVTKDENETLIAGLHYLVAILGKNINQENSKKILDLRNIIQNVKHITISDKKKNATSKARTLNREKSRKKVRMAYQNLKNNHKKITIYAIAKEAGISYQTAKKYQDIYEHDLV